MKFFLSNFKTRKTMGYTTKSMLTEIDLLNFTYFTAFFAHFLLIRTRSYTLYYLCNTYVDQHNSKSSCTCVKHIYCD